MTFETWRPSLLPAVVGFWNRSFSPRRNFVPLTARLFRERVLDHAEFDRKGFIVAREGREMAGAIHVGRRLDGHGYVAFLYVDAAHRRKGIGTRLWHRGLQAIAGAPYIAVLNGWENPFYGSTMGRTPPWGTPWGIGIEWSDSASLKFLARKGHAPRGRAFQLAIDLAGVVSKGAKPRRPELRQKREGPMVMLGWEPSAGMAWRGTASYFGFGKARPGLFGLYAVDVASADLERSSDRSLAKRLLVAALEDMRSRGGKSCEVLSSPDVRPETHQLYLKAGFKPVASWAVF